MTKVIRGNSEKERFVEKIDWKEFGRRIRSLMKLSGITTQMLAEDMKMRYRSLNNVINGHARPSLDLVLGLAMYFNVSIDYLLGRSNVPYFDFVDETGRPSELDEDTIFLARQLQLLSERERDALAVIVSAILGVGEEGASLQEGEEGETEGTSTESREDTGQDKE